MRWIGTLSDESQVHQFTAYLITRGIACNVDRVAEGWRIWIREEDQLPAALEHWREFQEAPHDPKYPAAVPEAEQVLRQRAQQQVASRKRIRRIDEVPRGPQFRAPLTMLLIGLSIAVWLLTGLGKDVDRETFRALAFAAVDGRTVRQRGWDLDSPGLRLDNLRRGEVWRLVSPIFIHFGGAHILFNLMALAALGRPIEHRYGTLYYGLMVLAIAVGSNLLQGLVPVAWEGTPPVPLPSGWHVALFGGMSGVIYGLFGFVWMKSEFDPASGFHLPLSTILWAIGWFFLGLSDLDRQWLGGSLANWAHGVGLAIGMAIGYASSFRRGSGKRPSASR